MAPRRWSSTWAGRSGSHPQPPVATRLTSRAVEALAVLGLPASPSNDRGLPLSLADLRAAFLRQALLWHPDRNGSEEATRRFQAVQEALSVCQRDLLAPAFDTGGARSPEDVGPHRGGGDRGPRREAAEDAAAATIAERLQHDIQTLLKRHRDNLSEHNRREPPRRVGVVGSNTDPTVSLKAAPSPHIPVEGSFEEIVTASAWQTRIATNIHRLQDELPRILCQHPAFDVVAIHHPATHNRVERIARELSIALPVLVSRVNKLLKQVPSSAAGVLPSLSSAAAQGGVSGSGTSPPAAAPSEEGRNPFLDEGFLQHHPTAGRCLWDLLPFLGINSGAAAAGGRDNNRRGDRPGEPLAGDASTVALDESVLDLLRHNDDVLLRRFGFRPMCLMGALVIGDAVHVAAVDAGGSEGRPTVDTAETVPVSRRHIKCTPELQCVVTSALLDDATLDGGRTSPQQPSSLAARGGASSARFVNDVVQRLHRWQVRSIRRLWIEASIAQSVTAISTACRCPKYPFFAAPPDLLVSEANALTAALVLNEHASDAEQEAMFIRLFAGSSSSAGERSEKTFGAVDHSMPGRSLDGVSSLSFFYGSDAARDGPNNKLVSVVIVRDKEACRAETVSFHARVRVAPSWNRAKSQATSMMPPATDLDMKQRIAMAIRVASDRARRSLELLPAVVAARNACERPPASAANGGVAAALPKVTCFTRLYGFDAGDELRFWAQVERHAATLERHQSCMNHFDVTFLVPRQRDHMDDADLRKRAERARGIDEHDVSPSLGGESRRWEIVAAPSGGSGASSEAETDEDEENESQEDVAASLAKSGWITSTPDGDHVSLCRSIIHEDALFQDWLGDIITQSTLSRQATVFQQRNRLSNVKRDSAVPLSHYLVFLSKYAGCAARRVLEGGSSSGSSSSPALAAGSGVKVLVVNEGLDIRAGGVLAVPWWVDPQDLLRALSGTTGSSEGGQEARLCR